MLVRTRLQRLALTVKSTFIQTEVNTWLCTSCHNVVGNTPASDRMGYAQANGSPWPGTPIGGLLAFSKSKFIRQNDTIK